MTTSEAAIVAEYLEARRVIEAGPPRQTGYRPVRPWTEDDPQVVMYRLADKALRGLAEIAQCRVD